MNIIEKYSEKFYSGLEDIFERENISIKNLLLQEFNKNKTKKTILDFGCGSGEWLELFIQLGGIVYAMDKSSAALDFCKNKYQHRNIIFMDFNEKKIKLQDNSVDVITVFWVFQEILNDNEMTLILSEMDRVLKKDGIIIVVENQYSDIRKIIKSTQYGDLLIDNKENVLRQFSNNTLVNIFQRLHYYKRLHKEFEMSFYEVYQKT